MLSPSKTTPVCTRTIVLREGVGHPGRLIVLAVASVMHAVGHAGLALLGGAVVVALGSMSVVTPGSPLLANHGAVTLAIAAIAVSAMRLAGSTCGAYASARMAGDVSTALRARVLKGLFAVHRLRHPRQADHGSACGDDALAAGRHARAVSALTLRIREVTSALESSLAAIRAALQLALLAAVVLVVAPRLFAVAMIVLAPFGWALGRVRKRLRAAQREQIERAESLLEAADEAVRHGELWQSFGAERKIQRVLGRLGREARDRTARLEAWSTAQTGANELLGIVAVALGLWALSTFASSEAARFAPFAIPFFLAYQPLRDLAEARLAMGRAGEAARELDAVLAHAVLEKDTDDESEREHARVWPLAELLVAGLSHRNGLWSPLSLRVEPGSIVALVGPTGCGKTTLLRVLLGLEAQDAGQVRYGSAALDGRGPGPLARPFAWAPQDAPVLAASLADNVQLAHADAASEPESNSEFESEARTSALLRSLGATSLLVLGGERLGSGHRALSGGERQWLSIARALATEQPVLLLDEPTSGLDPDSERAVLEALSRLRGTRTILIVTHREAPCAIADSIVRLGAAPAPPAARRSASSKTLEN